jgi:hypothetical protein
LVVGCYERASEKRRQGGIRAQVGGVSNRNRPCAVEVVAERRRLRHGGEGKRAYGQRNGVNAVPRRPRAGSTQSLPAIASARVAAVMICSVHSSAPAVSTPLASWTALRTAAFTRRLFSFFCTASPEREAWLSPCAVATHAATPDIQRQEPCQDHLPLTRHNVQTSIVLAANRAMPSALVFG